MFKFLKDKLKQAVDKIARRVEKEEILEEKPADVNLNVEKAIEKLEKIEAKEEKIAEPDIGTRLEKDESLKEIAKETEIEEKAEKQGLFSKLKEKIATKKIDAGKFNELFWELELALLENNVAVEVIEKIKKDLKKDLVDKPIKRNEFDDAIGNTLKKSISELFEVEKIDLLKNIKQKKDGPYIIVFLGLNGSGKTTTIAKFAKMLADHKLKCVLVAGDTWRQAAIEQLEEHGKKLGVKVIKHGYGSDPAAVAFDGIQHAKAKGMDVVLIDTAGRLHSNVNLMQEIKKIVKVAKPDMKIFVGESITGNDCVEQAREFDKAVSIDGIILTKADVDEKGGAAVSIGYVIKKPIMYLGTGQEYDSLKEFNKEDVIKSIGL